MTATDQIEKRLKGSGLVAELRALVRSFEHLGFEVVEVEISGGWVLRGSIVSLGPNIIGLPKKKLELAPGVYIDPCEFSYLKVIGERPIGHRPERDLYDETEPDRAGVGAGHRIELELELSEEQAERVARRRDERRTE